MEISVFNFEKYRDFLNEILQEQPKKGHGVRSVWAKAMGCQIAFVSHVLRGLYHLSAEQGESLARHLGLSKEETEYFILLIQRERAGTHHLEKFFREIIREKASERENIRRRMKIKENLSLEDQAIYYSKWLYSAVHMALTIPLFASSVDKIATYFDTPLTTIREILEFLETRGLISLSAGKYKVEKNLLFINKNSPFFSHQQVFLRQKAIDSIYKNNPEEIHFASIFTVAEKDVKKIKEILLKSIEQTTEVIKPSKEEKLYSLSLDLFEAR